MRLTFEGYLLRHFMTRVGLVLAGLTGILVAFDMMASTDEVITGDSVILPLLSYGWLRLPQIVALILPLASLIGAMLCLGQLAMRQELIAAMSGGISAMRLLLVLLVGGAGLAGLEIVLLNHVLPESRAELRLWADDNYRGLPQDVSGKRLPVWFSAGGILLHASNTGVGREELYDVTVLRRDEAGMIAEYLQARDAIYHDGVVTLNEVRRTRVGGGAEAADERLPSLALPLRIRPAELAMLTETVDELSFGELRRLNRKTGMKERIDDFYSTSIYRRLAQPASILVMILLALPLAFQLPRRGNLARAVATILAGGFGYLIAERILLALGEDGTIAPFPAAWAPLIVVTLLMALVLWRMQRPATRRRGVPPLAAKVA